MSETTTPASRREYVHQAVYAAKVVDQAANRREGKDPQVRVTARLTAKLKNPWKPAAGTDPLPSDLQKEQTVFLTFSSTRAKSSFRDLLALGFDGIDIDRLDPGHPQCFNLIGKDVLLRCTYSPDNRNPGAEREWWNVYSPRNTADDAKGVREFIDQSSEFLEAALAAAKEEENTPF